MRLALLPLLAACGTAPDATWHKDIRPIVEANCVDCHTAQDSVAPFPLTNFEEVSSIGSIVNAAVQARKMPPWAMDASCQDVWGSKWLDDEELALFEAWEAADFPEGDEEDYVAPELYDSPDAPREADTVVSMAPYTPDYDIPDDYRCLVVGEPTVVDLFVTATQVRPGNLDVAHHAILYAAPPAEIDAVFALDDGDPGEGFDCFGGPGSDDATMVAGWAPGGEGYRPMPDGAALRIPAGSVFVLQMHYNTLGGDPGDTDATEIDLWTLPPDVLPDELIIPWPVAFTGLSVGAGEASSLQRTVNRIPIEGRILSTSPHMHVRGVDQRVTLIRDDGAQECIADVPQYEFTWQRGYAYVEPIEVGWSDQFEIQCLYDNSAENQPFVDGERVEPQDITWGEGTLDEMCLNFVSVATPFYGDGNGAVCDGYATCAEGCDPGDPFCRMACMSSAGESCFNCGVEGVFGGCSISSCLTEVLAFQSCFDGCARFPEDSLECMYGQCNAQMQAYWTCAEAGVDDGSCAEDFADCPSLSGFR